MTAVSLESNLFIIHLFNEFFLKRFRRYMYSYSNEDEKMSAMMIAIENV